MHHTLLSRPCESLTGVGPALASKLKRCGLHTVQDLLFHLPYRYQDRTRITPIQDLAANDWAVIAGKVSNTNIQYGKKMTLSCYVEDATGFIKLRFFHFNKIANFRIIFQHCFWAKSCKWSNFTVLFYTNAIQYTISINNHIIG